MRSWNRRSGRGRLFSRWTPKSRRLTSSPRASWTIAAVDAERSTCPPWPASLIRTARMTSRPAYPSVVGMGSPVWRPMRTRTAPPGVHDAVARARWLCTAAATAWVARRNTTKNASPCVLTSQPSYAVKAVRSSVRWVSSTAGYWPCRWRVRAVLFSISVWSTVRVPLGRSGMHHSTVGRYRPPGILFSGRHPSHEGACAPGGLRCCAAVYSCNVRLYREAWRRCDPATTPAPTTSGRVPAAWG